LLPVSAEAAAAPDATVRKLERQLEELKRQLEERDAINRDLLRRVEEVEQRIGEGRDAPAPAQPATGRSTAAASKPAVQSRDAAASAPAARMDGEPAVRAAQATPTQETKPSAPGQVTATEEEAERALERTLTAVGALLLPYGQIEVEPSFTYTRADQKQPVFIGAGFADLRQRRNEFVEALGVRAGLPLNAQAELNLPYNIVQQESSLGGLTGPSRTGSGIGNLTVGLAKVVLSEKDWQPDVTTRMTWSPPTGEFEDDNVRLVRGSGFNQLRSELVALKRQDPFAFVASAAYQKTFNRIRGVEPGDQLGFSLGAFLAASPETSLSLSLNQAFTNDARFHGTVVTSSDQVQSVLNIGIASILARQVLLDLTVGVGLTDDAPDYSVMLSLPIRFPIPVP
jgi:hypothetical protein